MTCDFDNGRCCGACNHNQPERVCCVCETPTPDEDEHTEFKTCDGCGVAGCQHTIHSYDDKDYQCERFYCTECAEERSKLDKLY